MTGMSRTVVWAALASALGLAAVRRHKSWVHEGGIATPLIVHWPEGITTPGQLRHQVGHCIDFVPTLLDLAGGRATDRWNGAQAPPLAGRSLVPAITGNEPIPREFLFFNHGGNHALRVGDWKLVSARDDDAWQLYDLGPDRSEQVDVAAQHPDRARRMEARWMALETEFRRQAETP